MNQAKRLRKLLRRSELKRERLKKASQESNEKIAWAIGKYLRPSITPKTHRYIGTDGGLVATFQDKKTGADVRVS